MRFIGMILLVIAVVTGPVQAQSDGLPQPAQPVRGEVRWPAQWTVFLPFGRDDVVGKNRLAVISDVLEAGGRDVASQVVTPGPEGVFDFVPLFGSLAPGNTAYVFLEIESETAQQVTLGLGADWWMQAWLNGKEIVNTTNKGNEHWPPAITDHVVDAEFRKGTNVLAIKFISGSGSSRLAVGGPKQLRDAAHKSYSPVDPSVQGLDSFMERHGVKPYGLFFEGDGLRIHRLIFEDVEYGTPVWMVDDAPISEHSNSSSVWSPWNANASRLFLPAVRPLPGGGVMQGGLVNADYSRITPRLDDSRYPIWAPDNPDIYYLTPGNTQLREVNEAAGTKRTVARWEKPYTRGRVYGLTRDGRHAFLDTPNGGIWMPYEPGATPIPDSGLDPGRPAKPRPDGSPSHPLDNHELWYLKSLTTNHETWGPLVRVRVGLLIDRETGEIDPVIAPIDGSEAYLRLFMGQNGRILFPRNQRWAPYRIHRGDTLEMTWDIYHNLPTVTHGHQDVSPDGEFVVSDGMAARFWKVRTGTPFEQVKVSSDGEYYHMHWSIHPRFFVGWIRAWQFRTYKPTQNGGIVYQGFSDGTWQPIFNTHHRFNAYYAGGDFSMQSPDATKIHTASSMTGRFRNYVAVMARPRPPRQVRWQADGQTVRLSWEPSAYSKETRGYLVYRSTRSGEGYLLQTPEPVERTTWRDDQIQPGQDYYYVVTSLEHSGLESGFSMEAARAGVALSESVKGQPLVVYAEPEHSVRDLYTDERPGLALGRDVRGASDWYYLYRHPGSKSGEASMSIDVPVAGEYHLWARVRSNRPDNAWTRARGLASAPVTWRIELAGTTHEARTNQKGWTWVRAGHAVKLPADEARVTFATTDEGAEIDLIALASDAAFEPHGSRPEIRTTPDAAQNLVATNRRERVNELAWSASKDPAFAYYHVYASRTSFSEPSQRHRIASPTEPRFTDWGLRPGETYHYAVTVVDRWGNESAPVFAQASTPSRQHAPVQLELAFADAERQGPFEESKAGGLQGSAYLVPQQPESNRVSWRVSIPRDGDYFLWLRYLHRGSGTRANSPASHDVRALLDDKPLINLGGLIDLNVPDKLIAPEHPMANRFWTWAVPGDTNLESVRLPAGEHTLTLENLGGDIRYDVLLVTDEPAYRPTDGRLCQQR